MVYKPLFPYGDSRLRSALKITVSAAPWNISEAIIPPDSGLSAFPATTGGQAQPGAQNPSFRSAGPICKNDGILLTGFLIRQWSVVSLIVG
jgi:hypothetical protein